MQPVQSGSLNSGHTFSGSEVGPFHSSPAFSVNPDAHLTCMSLRIDSLLFHAYDIILVSFYCQEVCLFNLTCSFSGNFTKSKIVE